jgi:MFS superfamily sulfate permease-like transporter
MSNEAAAAKPDVGPVPKDWFGGLKQNVRFDIVSGLIIFLIVLPLCLAIAIASGAPPIAGVITGFVGGIVGSMLSGSHLTNNGPAAGMIVVVFGVVAGLADNPADPATGFKYALAVGVVCGVRQIGMGLAGLGAMTNAFNLSVVHGVLAGIGCIVMGQKIHTALGVSVSGGVFQAVAAIPSSFMNMNPTAALIGGLAILIMALRPKVPKISKIIPAPLLVMFTAVPLAAMFELDPKYLVEVPLNFMDSFQLPDWSEVATGIFWKGVFIYVFVASLESLLAAAAVDNQGSGFREP